MLISLLLPLILLSGLGWALTKFGLIPIAVFDAVGDLTVKLFIPSLLLMGMYTNGLPKNVSSALLLAYYLPFVSLFLVLALVFKKDARRTQLTFSAVYSNTVFIGIPVVVQVLSEESLRFAFPIIAFHSLIGFALYNLTDSLSDGLKNVKVAVKKTFRSPLVLSLLIGLFLNEVGVRLPNALELSFSMLGQAALPSALVVLGASLSQYKLIYKQEAVFVLLVKLILLPALVLIASHYLFNLASEITVVLLILSSCPVGVNAYILALADKKATDIVSSVILASSLLFVASFGGWLWLANQLDLCC